MNRQCTSCHEPISEKRLKALPNAMLCIGCQETKGVQVCRAPATDMARLGRYGSYHDDSATTGRRMPRISTGGLGAACAGRALSVSYPGIMAR